MLFKVDTNNIWLCCKSVLTKMILRSFLFQSDATSFVIVSHLSIIMFVHGFWVACSLFAVANDPSGSTPSSRRAYFFLLRGTCMRLLLALLLSMLFGVSAREGKRGSGGSGRNGRRKGIRNAGWDWLGRGVRYWRRIGGETTLIVRVRWGWVGQDCGLVG